MRVFILTWCQVGLIKFFTRFRAENIVLYGDSTYEDVFNFESTMNFFSVQFVVFL